MTRSLRLETDRIAQHTRVSLHLILRHRFQRLLAVAVAVLFATTSSSSISIFLVWSIVLCRLVV